MTKKEFLERYEIVGEFETKQKAEIAAMAFLSTLEEAFLRGEEIPFVGFGKFEVIEKPAKVERNRITGMPTRTDSKKMVRFRLSKKISEKLNK